MRGAYRTLGWLSALCFGAVFVGGLAQSIESTGAPPGIHTGYNGALDVLLAPDHEGASTIEQLELALEIVINERHIQHTNLGVALEAEGRLGEAIEHYRHSLAIRPDHSGAHSSLGTALLATGEGTEGLEHLEEAHRLAPGDPNVMVNIARVHGQAGEHARAEGLYRRALEVAPDHATAHYNLARTLDVLGRAGEAEGLYRRALDLDGTYEVRSRRHLARSLVSQRRWREASAELGRALALSPDEPGLALEAAKAMIAGGHRERAQPLLEQALAKSPQDPEVLTLLARLLATHGDRSQRRPARAVKLGERARELTGAQHPAVLDALASAFAAQGRYEEATRTARAAIERARARGQEGLARLIEGRLPRYGAPAAPESPEP